MKSIVQILEAERPKDFVWLELDDQIRYGLEANEQAKKIQPPKPDQYLKKDLALIFAGEVKFSTLKTNTSGTKTTVWQQTFEVAGKKYDLIVEVSTIEDIRNDYAVYAFIVSSDKKSVGEIYSGELEGRIKDKIPDVKLVLNPWVAKKLGLLI